MSDRLSVPAAIKAQFAEFKMVKTRSVAALVFEIPLEAADAAIAMLGGVPLPGKEPWCGIARLVAPPNDPAEPPSAGGGAGGGDSPPAGPPTGSPPPLSLRALAGRAAYEAAGSGGKAVTRAALLAKDQTFQGWLVATGRLHALAVPTADMGPEEAAADYIRKYCGVGSRREIGHAPLPQKRFEEIEASFEAWRKGWA